MKISLGIQLILLLILPACSKSKYAAYDSALSKIYSQHEMDTLTTILVLPRAGCESCILDATDFALKNYPNFKNTGVLITLLDDYKRVKFLLGTKFLNSSKVKIDKNNYFANSEITSNYPHIINIENGKVHDMAQFDRAKVAHTIK